MREWNLGPGDPLELIISADFRLSTPDYTNDQTWELVTLGGDPPALAFRTTYGLRARSMRIFPRFTIAGQTVADPAAFVLPPRLRRFYPNFMILECSPFQNIDVQAEYWVPGSQCCAGRFSFTNKGETPVACQLELCVQLVPFEGGHPMAPLPMQSVNVLVGQTGNLAPVVFLTGGPQVGGGPYPCLTVSRMLDPKETRTLGWAQAALGSPKDSMELARLTAAQPWEPARARIDLTNAAQSLEVNTGNPDWDAALALGQKTAFRLFFGPAGSLPRPSFVTSRQPDQGHSPGGDGRDYPPAWSGQTPLEAYYLSSLLPGTPAWAEGLLRNFLAVQTPEGTVNGKAGLAGQKGGGMAAPLLASLAWRVYQHTSELRFLQEVLPGLEAFASAWLTSEHDRDGDGFPEWDQLLQSGFEDHPAFSVWQSGGQGAGISTAEQPSLGGLLAHEFQCLAHIAEAMGESEEQARWTSQAEKLARLTASCWNERRGIYQSRDRDSHLSPKGKTVARLRGEGTLPLDLSFKGPARLLVRMELAGPATRSPRVTLSGRQGETLVEETFERADFQWGAHLAVATSRKLYTSIEKLEVTGMEKRDRLFLQLADYSSEDVTLFLPLWAGIPDREQAALLQQTLFDPGRFGQPFGAPACPDSVFSGPRKASAGVQAEMEPIGQAVHLPWNSFVAEGLLNYEMRQPAAQLYARLMGAVIQNLKRRHAFSSAYHAGTGEGLGERNSLRGLPSVGLFLQILGVQILSPRRVVLSGKNPYPWPVTVQYRGLTVTRQADQTVVVFPNGQSQTLPDPTDATVSID